MARLYVHFDAVFAAVDSDLSKEMDFLSGEQLDFVIEAAIIWLFRNLKIV